MRLVKPVIPQDSKMMAVLLLILATASHLHAHLDLMGWTAPRSITASMGHDGSLDHRPQNEEGAKMGVTIIGIDLAKNLFRLHGCDEQGRAVLRKRLTRGQLLGFIAQVPACTVAMEACASAHYWAREIEQLGHSVRLVNPRFVKPYVKANKNDASDAEAICEAASRASMRFVPVKTAAQLEVQALHRVRQQLVKSRTALINQVRGLLAEHGIVIPQGRAQLQHGLALILEDADHRLSSIMREILGEIGARLKFIEE